MKLLSYHIENYGKLRDVDGDFSSNLTCFCEENGFGKSTLASFIKAMFYGLASYTVASKTFNDRQKYYPFHGGKFGGNLTFFYQGKTYRIERFFDKKSAKNDECTVYQDDVIYKGFGEDIGKSVFGLDEESFKRTTFITAEEVEISSTHSINEKLHNVVGGVEFGDDFENAIDALERAKKQLKAARGNNDKISEAKEQILFWNRRITNLVAMSESLSQEYFTRKRLQEEIDRLEETLAKASDKNVILQKWATYDAFLSRKKEKEEKLFALKEEYPFGFPSVEERQILQKTWEENNRLRGGLQSSALSSNGEERLSQLESVFKNGIPRDEVIEEYQEKITRITALKRERKLRNEKPREERVLRLEERFKVGLPQEERMAKMRGVAEEYKAKKQEWERRFKERMESKPMPKTNLSVYFFVLATALLFGGVGLYFLEAMFGIGLGAAGLIFLVVAGALRLFKPTMPPTKGQEALLSMQMEWEKMEAELRDFTARYGYRSEAGALYDFVLLEEDAYAYKESLRGAQEENARLEKLTAEISLLERETRNFLEEFGETSEDLQGGINRLTANVLTLRNLREDRRLATRRDEEKKAALLEGEARVTALLEKYGLNKNVATMDGLNRLELNVKTFEDCLRAVEKLQMDAQEYKALNTLVDRPAEEEENVEEMRAILSKTRRELADCDKRITETERSVEELPEAEKSLQIAEEKLEKYKEKYALITDTLASLREAEQGLKDKYVAPIKNRFSVYAAALEKVLNEKVRMDPDFKIVFERGGETRSDKHLSAGEKSLCALCLRLALVDTMYGEEQPFIVMDDPFVHLDEKHMARTRDVVRELAKDRQIVYFCCHESRKI